MNDQKKIKKINLAGVLIMAALFGFSSCTDNVQKDSVKNTENAAFAATSDLEDAEFLVDAAEINLEEIQLGQLAQTNGESDEVKKLGKMMEEDHTKSFNELKDLASKKSMTIPASVSEEGKEAYNKLNDKKESDFDKEYVSMMIKGHTDAISEFEKATKECKDEDIKAWAEATLPALKKHLDHAMMCQSKFENM